MRSTSLTGMTSKLISGVTAVASCRGRSNYNDMEIAALRQPLSAAFYLYPRLI